MDLTAPVSIAIGVGADVILWLLPREWLSMTSRWIIGGLAAMTVVYGVAVLVFMRVATVRVSFWPAVVIGGTLCGVIGSAVIGLAWKHVQVQPTAFQAEDSPASPSSTTAKPTEVAMGKKTPKLNAADSEPPVKIPVSVQQHSEGGNSPNIVTLGPNSPVTINPKVDPHKPVVTYNFEGYKRVTAPGFGSIQNGEEKVYEKIKEHYEAQNWSELVAVCEAEIKKVPEWYTPYLFAGVAYEHLGQRDKAIGYLEHVSRNVGDLPEYRKATELLKALRNAGSRQ